MSQMHLSSCKYPLSCQILIKLDISRQIFRKILEFRFHTIPSSGSRVVPCGQVDGRKTDKTKIIILFRNSEFSTETL